MTKQEIKIFSQDMTRALLEPLNHCAEVEENIVFKSVLDSIVHLSNLYCWIVVVDSNLIPGSYFELQALSEINNSYLFSIFFSDIANVINQLFDRLPNAIQESVLEGQMCIEYECDEEENSLQADIIE